MSFARTPPVWTSCLLLAGALFATSPVVRWCPLAAASRCPRANCAAAAMPLGSDMPCAVAAGAGAKSCATHKSCPSRTGADDPAAGAAGAAPRGRMLCVGDPFLSSGLRPRGPVIRAPAELMPAPAPISLAMPRLVGLRGLELEPAARPPTLEANALPPVRGPPRRA